VGSSLKHIRLDDFADGLAGQHRADLNRRSIRWAGIHSAAHVPIKREVNRPRQHLAGTGLGNFGLGKLEIVLRRLAAGARREQNLVVLCRLSRFGAYL
jgi:hypothetical protein